MVVLLLVPLKTTRKSYPQKDTHIDNSSNPRLSGGWLSVKRNTRSENRRKRRDLSCETELKWFLGQWASRPCVSKQCQRPSLKQNLYLQWCSDGQDHLPWLIKAAGVSHASGKVFFGTCFCGTVSLLVFVAREDKGLNHGRTPPWHPGSQEGAGGGGPSPSHGHCGLRRLPRTSGRRWSYGVELF